ncbi:MAG TPA: response regulator [Chthoniobacterales bacterium]|nr:response regulator [Chthoniobacterales bacterium]
MLVDDEADALELYGDLLEEKGFRRVTRIRHPSHALKAAQEKFFDLIVMDVTMHYNGTMFGGFELYKSLIGRYGAFSLLAYSQYITDDLLKQYDYNFNFIEKHTDPRSFVRALSAKMRALMRQQFCFVAMPFSQVYRPIYTAIKECVEAQGYNCFRIDDAAFTASIVDRILEGIRQCQCLIFLATDKNPNAFYECGYAVALRKEIIMLTDKFSNLPFDVRDRRAIEYKNNLQDLKRELSVALARLAP